MKTLLVLAMHGVPPNDFPRREIAEFFELHGRVEMSPAALGLEARRRYEELEGKIRSWPRTPANDPYHAASLDLARELRNETGFEVLVGFNEFCSPDVGEALSLAVQQGASRIVVLTAMLTRGGGHAQKTADEAPSAGHRSPPPERIRGSMMP